MPSRNYTKMIPAMSPLFCSFWKKGMCIFQHTKSSTCQVYLQFYLEIWRVLLIFFLLSWIFKMLIIIFLIRNVRMFLNKIPLLSVHLGTLHPHRFPYNAGQVPLIAQGLAKLCTIHPTLQTTSPMEGAGPCGSQSLFGASQGSFVDSDTADHLRLHCGWHGAVAGPCPSCVRVWAEPGCLERSFHSDQLQCPFSDHTKGLGLYSNETWTPFCIWGRWVWSGF